MGDKRHPSLNRSLQKFDNPDDVALMPDNSLSSPDACTSPNSLLPSPILPHQPDPSPNEKADTAISPEDTNISSPTRSPAEEGENYGDNTPRLVDENGLVDEEENDHFDLMKTETLNVSADSADIPDSLKSYVREAKTRWM
jgi:hypothetical protein